MKAPEVISVLAGGWSARDIDRARLPGLVIGVNDSMILAPCDLGVTMDRLWFENRFAALDKATRHTPEAQARLNVVYARRAALQNIKARPTWLHPFECDHTTHELSASRGRLNGTNSGLCALSLAFQLKPRRVILFGFDMCRSPEGAAYWFPDYEWTKPGGATSDSKYANWAREFADVAKQFRKAGVEVFNASPHSKVEAFAKVSPESVMS